MPRKSKYTTDVVKRIVDAIHQGTTYEVAAAYGGISYDTLRTWINTKPAFSDAVKEAEAQAVVLWLAKIEKAASDGNWQAAAWKLERRYPEVYGRQVHQVEQQGEVRIVITRKDKSSATSHQRAPTVAETSQED